MTHCKAMRTLVTSKDVEKHRVYPFIETGYRKKMKCLDCVKSTLFLHNQSLNIWIHLLGSMLFITTAIDHYMEGRMQQTYTDVFLSIFFFTSCIFMLLLSAIYHTFEPVNKKIYGITLSCDLIGTAMSIMGSILYGTWVVLRCEPMYRNLYSILIVLSVSGMVFTSLQPDMRDNLKIVVPVFGFGTASGLLPAIHFATTRTSSNFQGYTALFCVAVALSLMIVGIVIFMTRFPERKYPKTFDIFGSSHQWWHICVLLSPYVLYQGLIRTLGVCSLN